LIHFEPARLLGGAYLVWLALRHFQEELEAGEPVGDRREAPARCHEQGPEQGAAQGGEQGVEQGDLALLATIAGTDLAFSLDSVSASVAVTEALPLVVLGGGLGVLMLRFLAGWVLGWMERYVHLANAAYLTVLAVGLKMLAASLAPVLVPAPGVLLVGMVILFGWGFSQTREPRLPPVQAALIGGSAAGRVLSSSSNGVCSSPSFTKPNTSRL
jgi:predicted tellurium resistance membrane protein TerC